jgi:O-antigen ligase
LSVGRFQAGAFVSPISDTTEWLKREIAAWPGLALFMTIGWLVLFSPLIDGGTTQLPVLVIRLVIVLCAGLWLVGRTREGSLFLPQTPLAVSVALFCGWSILSITWSPYKNASVQWILSIVSYAMLFAMVTQGIRLPGQRWALVLLVTGVGMSEGIWGLSQYLWLGAPRARGTFFNPNFFAAYEAAVFLLSLGVLLFSKRETLSVFWKSWLCGAAAVSLAAFVVAQSRGAAFALIGAVSFLTFCRYGRKASAILVVCLLAGVTVPNPLQHRIMYADQHDAYAYTRLEIWKSSAERLFKHPLGIGVGMYKQGSFQDRFPIEGNIVRYGKRPESAHNEYLQIGVELGIVGLLVFLGGLWMWSAEIRQLCCASGDRTNRGLVMGLTGSALVVLLHAAVDSTFHEPALVILLILMAGLTHNLAMQSGSTAVVWRRIAFGYHPLRVAAVVVGMLLIAAVCSQSAVGWYAHEEGKRHAGQQHLEQAMSWYVRAAAIDPGTTGYHDSIARTALQLFDQSGNSDWLLRAAEEEAMARSLNQADARFAFRLGTIYQLMAAQTGSKAQRGELLEKASGVFADAIHLDPFSPLSYYELAQLHLVNGRTDAAIALLTTARGYEPNFLPGRALLAELSLKAGKPGDYQREYAAIKAVQSRYAGRELNDIERRFLDVDLYPLGRALAIGAMS